MPNQFQLSVPTGDDLPANFTIEIGKILYVLGADGSGKSGLVSRLFNANQRYAKRISAHRQTWFESNTLDMTPRSRQDVGYAFQSQDSQVQARYREWNPSARSLVRRAHPLTPSSLS